MSKYPEAHIITNKRMNRLKTSCGLLHAILIMKEGEELEFKFLDENDQIIHKKIKCMINENEN